jgi:hypothetical protein
MNASVTCMKTSAAATQHSGEKNRSVARLHVLFVHVLGGNQQPVFCCDKCAARHTGMQQGSRGNPQTCSSFQCKYCAAQSDQVTLCQPHHTANTTEIDRILKYTAHPVCWCCELDLMPRPLLVALAVILLSVCMVDFCVTLSVTGPGGTCSCGPVAAGTDGDVYGCVERCHLARAVSTTVLPASSSSSSSGQDM